MGVLSVDDRYPEEARIVSDIRHVVGHLRRTQQRMAASFHADDLSDRVIEAILMLEEVEQSIVQSIRDYPDA